MHKQCDAVRIVAQSITGLRTVQLLDTLNEINERHEAVKELNKSLVELSQMFTDMAVLVEQQGVMINNIESQVRRPKHLHKVESQGCFHGMSFCQLWLFVYCGVHSRALHGRFKEQSVYR